MVFNISVEGVDVVIANLTKLGEQLNDTEPLFDRILNEIRDVLFDEAPVVTGNFAANIIPEYLDSSHGRVIEPLQSEGGLPYAARVLFGYKKDGNAFSEQGHDLFNRNITRAEEIVINVTNDYITNILG